MDNAPIETEEALNAAMDAAFTALLRRWQDAVPPLMPGAGTVVWTVCRVMKDWLGASITTRDPTNPLLERLDPGQMCARITRIAHDAGVSRPQTLLAVVALIDRIIQSTGVPGRHDPAIQVWAQYLEESALTNLWAGAFNFKPPQRSFRWPPER